MYLRHSTIRKNGKNHVYWRLVRSVRRNGKVIQQTVAQLGELDAEGRSRAKALARRITGRAEQRELFETPAAPAADAKVRLDRIRLERGRSFGDVWLGWRLWQALRLDTPCAELLPRGGALGTDGGGAGAGASVRAVERAAQGGDRAASGEAAGRAVRPLVRPAAL